MPESQDNRAGRAVNPTTTFEIDLLGSAEAGIAVEIRPDIGAIEVVIRDHGQADQRRAGAGRGGRAVTAIASCSWPSSGLVSQPC